MALCFGGITAILHFEWHAAFTILPGIFALLVVLGMSEMLLWSSRLQVHSDSVTVTSGLFGFRKTRKLLPEEIESVESATDLHMERTTFYSVILKAADGQTFTLVKRLESRQEADLLADWIRNKMPAVKVVQPPAPENRELATPFDGDRAARSRLRVIALGRTDYSFFSSSPAFSSGYFLRSGLNASLRSPSAINSSV